MKHKIKIAVCTHIGNSRENQEDSVLVCCDSKTLLRNSASAGDPDNRNASFSLPARSTLLIAVSDGMGGHLGGEIASGYAVSRLEARAPQPQQLQETLAALSDEVEALARANPAYRGMGATISGLYAQDGAIRCFHAGDSRIYRYTDGTLEQCTRDHTQGQRLMDLGLLTEEEARRLPHGKSIYQYIGMGSTLCADVFDMPAARPGTLFLVCSDGLTDALTDREIREILSREEPLEVKRERFLREALGRRIGFGDNISFVLAAF